jgi:hypothetical protein
MLVSFQFFTFCMEELGNRCKVVFAGMLLESARKWEEERESWVQEVNIYTH